MKGRLFHVTNCQETEDFTLSSKNRTNWLQPGWEREAKGHRRSFFDWYLQNTTHTTNSQLQDVEGRDQDRPKNMYTRHKRIGKKCYGQEDVMYLSSVE